MRGTSRPIPLCENAPPDLPVDPSDNARSLAILFSLGKFQFFDAGDLTWNVEKQLVCPDRPGRAGRFVSGDASWNGYLQPSDLDPDPRADGRHHEQRTAEGGAPATVKLLRSVPSIQAAYQLHRNAATSDDDNTDPSLIANKGSIGRRVHSRASRARRLEVHGPDRRARPGADVRVEVKAR